MKLKNNFLSYVMLVQCFSLFSYEASLDNSNGHNNASHVEIHVNSSHKTLPKNNWHFSTHVKEMPNYSHRQRANYTVIAHGSPDLQHYFHKEITSLIYNATIQNHCCALPGYSFSNGLRGCINQLSQFSGTDTVLISDLKTRLETYCTRIENVLFSGKDYAFCDIVPQIDQIKLIKIYADFLKEFYANAAPHIFYNESQTSSLMQQVMPTINWQYYDGGDFKSKPKKLEQQRAASVNGNLGIVYKALHGGNFEKAYIVGREEIKTIVGKTTNVTSVFERYPALRQKVEQAYQADKAKTEQELMAKEKDAQQKAVVVQSECLDRALTKLHLDTLQNRYDAAARTIINSQFFKQIHKITPPQTDCFFAEHLTSDRKGILFDGNHLQHHLVDETITVVDVVASGDLVENMQDAVIDLANASLTLNKNGDVIMASRTLDACWALIDFAQDAAHYAYSTLSTHVPLVAKGACDGICESLHGAVHVVCHPVEAAKDVVSSFVTAGYYLGKIAYVGCVLDAAYDVLETDSKHYEQIIQQYAIDPYALIAVYEHAKENISTEDVARVGTKVVVDMMLLHGVTKAVSAIAQESLPAFVSCMRKGSQSSEVALTAEGVPVRCAEEVASLMNSMERASGSVEVAAEALASSRQLVENMVGSFMSEVKTEIETLKNIFECMQNCVPNCVKKGFAEFKNKHIKIPYEHIFGIELKWNEAKGTLSGISGFHHDFMGAIEKSGFFEFTNKIFQSNRCYKSKLFYKGNYVKEITFFPADWPREKVIRKIYEAYDNFIKSSLVPDITRDGKYMLRGATQEGIEIEMFVTKKGQITTAYPII